MLQINTGKLFTREVERTNQLTGVLYSNLRLPHGRDIRTAAGSLRSTGYGPVDLALVYEVEERIELGPSGPGVLVSHTVGPYLDQFAVVASFGLGGIVGRSEGAVRTLTDGRAGGTTRDAPSQYVSRIFDQTTYLSSEEAEQFERFVADLLALERKSYLGALRAMHTFTAGLRRIPDDLGQAYVLMVSALESLAQDFDAFIPTWADVDEGKRRAIDSILAGVGEDTAGAVRAALLAHEHVAIARRYRAFALSHIDAAFFRQASRGSRPVARYELAAALASSYNLRSKWVHQGRPLPDPIMHPHGHWETTTVERRPALTLEGLVRITSHVIRSFVEKQPKVEREPYDYTHERHGIVIMEWAPQYTIWRPFTDPAHSRKRLEGLMSLICALMMREPDAGLVDMRPMLADVERLLPQAPRQHRLAMLSLHILFNFMVAPEMRSPEFDAFYEAHADEAGTLGVESVVVASLLSAEDDWDIEAHAAMLDRYFSERVRPSGLHAPRLAEAAMCLTLAEKFRIAGDDVRTRGYVGMALEAHPGRLELHHLERELSMDTPLAWRAILLPTDEHSADDASAPLSAGDRSADIEEMPTEQDQIGDADAKNA